MVLLMTCHAFPRPSWVNAYFFSQFISCLSWPYRLPQDGYVGSGMYLLNMPSRGQPELSGQKSGVIVVYYLTCQIPCSTSVML